MAARGQPKVSLFPFMSVLACTIGALMMLLVAMSLAAVEAGDTSMRAYAATKESVETDRQAIERERLRLDRAEALWSEVDAALDRAAELIDQTGGESRRRRLEELRAEQLELARPA